jgi:hypothetical protein
MPLLYIGMLVSAYILATIAGAIVTGDRPDCWPWKR